MKRQKNHLGEVYRNIPYLIEIANEQWRNDLEKLKAAANEKA